MFMKLGIRRFALYIAKNESISTGTPNRKNMPFLRIMKIKIFEKLVILSDILVESCHINFIVLEGKFIR